MKNKKRNCDERQVFAPIRAVQMGFASIIALVFANFFLRDALGSAWAAPEVDMAAILCFSMGAYAARCVWTDAYFTAWENLRRFAGLCIAWAAPGTAASMRTISGDDGIVNGAPAGACATPAIALYMVSPIALTFKRSRARREEDAE